MHDVDTIFHLGAQTIVSTAHRSPGDFESNVHGTWNVLDVARVHSSGSSRRGGRVERQGVWREPVLPYVESMPLHGTYPYEVSKSMTDLVSQSYASTYGVPVVIARCGNIYGRGDLNWSRIVPGTIRRSSSGSNR